MGRFNLPSVVSYVDQIDGNEPLLTVKETLGFAASCIAPSPSKEVPHRGVCFVCRIGGRGGVGGGRRLCGAAGLQYTLLSSIDRWKGYAVRWAFFFSLSRPTPSMLSSPHLPLHVCAVYCIVDGEADFPPGAGQDGHQPDTQEADPQGRAAHVSGGGGQQ